MQIEKLWACSSMGWGHVCTGEHSPEQICYSRVWDMSVFSYTKAWIAQDLNWDVRPQTVSSQWVLQRSVSFCNSLQYDFSSHTFSTSQPFISSVWVCLRNIIDQKLLSNNVLFYISDCSAHYWSQERRFGNFTRLIFSALAHTSDRMKEQDLSLHCSV
jgi:hypothetical protein